MYIRYLNMEETFKNWFAENKESLTGEHAEYKANMKLDGWPACEIQTLRQFSKERYDSIFGM